MSSKTIDWKKVNAALPFKRDAASEKQRNDLWKQFDVNGNGKLSLAEIDKAMRDVLNLDSLFSCKAAIARAFQTARSVDGKGSRWFLFCFVVFVLFLFCVTQKRRTNDRQTFILIRSINC